MTSTLVLDNQVLVQMAEELEDWPPVWEFICRYISLLDHRIDRLDRALNTDDADEQMDAILSLKVSSAMAGAIALSHAAAQLQEHMSPGPHNPQRWPTDDQRSDIIADLSRLAEETRHRLNLFLQLPAVTVGNRWRPSC